MMWILNRKIKSKSFFNYDKKKLNIKGIKASIPNEKIPVDLSLGEISKENFPVEISEELKRLDLLQLQIASAINSLSEGPEKEAQKGKYINTLIEMFKTAQNQSPYFTKKKNNIEITQAKGHFKSLNKYLSERGFQSTGLPNNLITNSGYVIWPITLQPSVTYIHTAQIQLIRLLVQAGWKLHVIIGDCGKHAGTIKSPIYFKDSISNLLKKNQIDVDEKTVTLLSKYFKRKPDFEDPSLLKEVTSLDLLNTFHNISDSILWCDYFTYITKNYNKTKKQEIIKNRKVLSNLQPLLNWTVVITISNGNQSQQSKAIVIAGEDEKKQWDEVIKLHGNNRIGMIYIHELKYQNKTMDQSEINIGSELEMVNKLGNGNMCQWLYTHFVELPKFLTNSKPPFCKISENKCNDNNNNCIKCLFEGERNFNDKDFNKIDFVSKIYEIANPVFN